METPLRNFNEDALEGRITEKLNRLRTGSAEFGNPWVMTAYEVAARDEEFRHRVQLAVDRSEVSFRKLEALRIHLAKHEIPKSKGYYGMAPGYGRIDESTGSIFWQVPLGKMEVDMISRRSLCELCRRFPIDESIMIFPDRLRSKLAKFSNVGYGIKFVRLGLDNGSNYDAYVAWDCQILKVPGDEPMRLEPNRITDVTEAKEQDR